MNSLSRAEVGSIHIYRCLRRCYSTSDQAKKITDINLQAIFEEKILQKPIIWQDFGLGVLKSDLGEGITAYLFPRIEENTSIRISNGFESISREISAFWLENWTIGEKVLEKQ